MPTIAELLNVLEQAAPSHIAYKDDPIGLQVGRKSDQFFSCLVSLDATPSAIEHACDLGAKAVVSHHPIIYHPVKSLAGDGYQTQALRLAIANSVAIVAAHTNWDAAAGGVNETLAQKLNLQNVQAFGQDIGAKAYKLVTFVPDDAVDAILDALSAAGAGQIGLYKRCAFYNDGFGTFEPQEGAQPSVGQVGERETVEERRIEMRLPASARDEVVAALLKAHPYEEPAYDIWEVSNVEAFSLPRMGDLPEAIPFGELCAYVDRAINSRSRGYGNTLRKVSKVGVIGGSGGSYWMKAKLAGCDALVTGEVRHHEGVEAAESGMCILDAGHYHTEQPGVEALAKLLSGALPDAEFHVFEPLPGRSGHPN